MPDLITSTAFCEFRWPSCAKTPKWLEEGTTYSRLIEQIRFEQAIRWLQDPAVKLGDIASQLGYKNSTHFSRAFKRWTGLNPRQYRLSRSMGTGR
ncbi:helix-turn-helix transcriptional regulator [Synechocystis sp. LEGE 06083]|uniref:helix-turn-helix domain-containing protein n=1 Tax=Synechocystis sp. LEGE 06083 TaxID=915336 RepID=UPI0018824264|nr:helix-turn-helix transcriptional regulator [Synechocystis sp. LEGE 06083]